MIEKIICGDCLEVMKDIQDKSISMILCDLPYQITRCKWDSIIPFEPLWEQYNRVIKDNGAIILTASQPFTTSLISSNIKHFKYTLVWDKKLSSGFLNAKKMPLRRHEDICVFYKKAPTYNPQMEVRGKPRKKGGYVGGNKGCYGEHKEHIAVNNEYYPTSIIEVSNADQTKKVHATQKPLTLFEYLVKTYTNENDIVLDNCMGSFTTAVACDNLNRRWIGIEKEMEYCEIGLKRVNDNRVALGLEKVELIEY